MSNCKIIKNKDGKINDVLNQTGQSSSLFKEILNTPTLSLDEAIQVYQNIYSEKLKEKVQFQIIGEKGAKNLDQIEEATFRMDNLKVAREMEAAGKTPKEIRLATGWEKNLADGKWRYEILDGVENNISVEFNKENKSFTNTNIATVLLPELYNNQELYKAYPILKKTPVIFYNDSSFFGDLSGFTWQDRIFLNSKKFIDGQNKYRGNLSNKDDRFTLQHEIQHILQDIEGFDRSTSTKTQEKKIKESLDYIRDNRGKTRNSYDIFLKNYLSKDVNFLERLLLKVLPTDKIASVLAQKFYLLKVGEVEARNVQLRANFTQQERIETLLSDTQQVSYEKQLVDVSEQDKDFIVTNLGGSQMSFLPQKNFKKGQITPEILERLRKIDPNIDFFLLSTEEINAKLIELGVSEDVRKQIEAWHGSPYAFDRFTTNAMGTGEGAQAFGWGLYFTDLESIGREYAEKLANSKNEEIEDIYSKFFKDSSVLEPTNKFVDMLVQAYGYKDNTDLKEYRAKNNNIKDVLNYLYEDFGVYINADQYISKDGFTTEQNIKKVKDDGFFTKESVSVFEKRVYNSEKYQKNLYKVSLHKGKTPSEYTWLDWDKEFSFTTELQEKLKNTLPSKLKDGITESYFTSSNEENNINSLSSIIDTDSIEVLKGYGIYNFKDFSDLKNQVVSTINDWSEDFEEDFNLSATSNDTKRDILNKLENNSGKINFISEQITGEKVYKKISQILGSGKKASLFLLENGIDGIKYPAESLALGATSDTARGFNYVVFDENAITIEEQIQFSKSLNNVGINLITNGLTYKDSKTGKDIVILNKYTADDSTSIHEFNHILNSFMRQNRPELYKKGIDLVNVELEKENSEIADIISYVKTTQPNLIGEALSEEILTELTGRKGAELINSKKNSGIIDWIKEFFAEIGQMLGILDATPQEIANMTLGEFAQRSAVQLLKGDNIAQNSIQQAIKRNNGNPLNLTPNGKPSILYQSYKDLGYSEQEAERLTAQVYSDSFINNFFGDWLNDPQNASKVIDENGMPLVVFHGTNAKFTEFQNRIGIRGNQFTGSREVKSDTFFFTDNIEYAEKASNIRRENFGGNKNIISSFLNIKNPLNFTTFDYKTEELFNEITGEFPSSYFGYNDSLDQWWRLFDKDEDDVTDIVKEKGYNGVMLAEEVKTVKDDKGYDIETASVKSFGVFNPNQIKSATENIGTFSTDSNDIRFQIIGEKGASRVEEYNSLLNQAKELEKQGEDYSQTGWYKGVDGWKYLSKEAIEDFKIINKEENKILKLKEVLGDENVLFKIYPEMQDLSVVFYNRNAKNSEKFKPLANNERGEFDSNDKIIRINTNHKANQGNIQGLQFTLGYEVAHKIQRVENFSRGGNATTVLNEALSILNIENTGNLGEIYSKIVKANKSNLTNNQLKIIKDSSKTIEALLTNNEDILEGQYLRLSGEIDANIIGELVSKGTATGTYSDLLSLYLNDNNIDPESIYFISGNQVQFSLRQDVSQPRQIAIEPSLSFETPKGETFDNYSDALKNTDEGTIKLKIDDVTLGEVSSSTDINTLLGSINDLVRQGILKGERLLNPDGTISFVTNGKSLIKKLVNATISEEQFNGNKVKPSIDSRGDISIEEKTSFYESIKDLDYNKVKSKYGTETASIVLAARIYEEYTKPFGQNRLIEDRQEITPENELQERLLNLLNTLGIKTMSLEKYKKTYEQRNGVLPSSNALADIANRVIAFTNGEVTQDALTEEVAHFIIEATSQEEITPLLENIHKTDEWAQYAEGYFNIYQDENIVRREVLGKVLKNALQDKFEKSQQTGTANTIIGKLMDLVNKFFTRISQFLTPQHIIDLNEYTQKIYNNLMLGELAGDLNQEQLEGNHLILLQTSKNIESEADLLLKKLNKALEHAETQDRKINSSKEEILTLKEALRTEEDIIRDSLDRAKTMETNGETMESIVKETGWEKDAQNKWVKTYTELGEILRAALSVTNIVNRQVNYLEKRAKKNLLSSEESAVFALTAGYMYKVLTEIESIIKKKAGMTGREELLKELGKTLTNIRTLQGDTNIAQEENVKRIFEKVGDELGLSEEEKQQLLTNFNNIKRDTNVFYAYVGGAINAHNPILNIASALISKAYADRDIAFNTKMREFMGVTKKAGYTEEQVAKMMSKWKRGHFVFSRFDFIKQEKDMLDEKVKAFKEAFGKEVTATQLEKDEDTLLKAESTQNKKLYYKKINDYRQENQVYSPLNEEETKKANKIYAKVSLETQMKDKELSRTRSAITRDAKRNGGFSESEKFRMEELIRKRAILKNPFTNKGYLKEGLSIDENDEVAIADGFTLDTLDADSKLTYELNLLDKLKAESFKESRGETKIPENFIKEINSIVDEDGNPDLQKRKEFIKANTNISFSSEFWDTFDKNEGVVAKLIEIGEDVLADEIKLLTNRRKHILKANRVFNNPSEINTEIISGETDKSLIEIEARLEDAYKAANKELKKEDRVRNEMSELVTNQAYRDKLEDSEIVERDDILAFIKEHTTPSNKNKIDSAKLIVEAYKNGHRKSVSKALEPFITSIKDADSGLIAYAETKLASYYKKLQPVGFDYETLLANIASDPNNFFTNMPKDISAIPNYIFLGKDENSRVNPKFAKNLEEGEPQLQLYTNNPEYKDGRRVDYKYGSKEFADYFGIADLENPQPTKNQKEYEVLTALYKFQSDTIDKAGMKGKHNRYLLPQKRPETLNRIANIKADNKGNLKEGFKELFAYREDDAIYGQTDGRMNLGETKLGEMTIPRHGFNRMESENEVTNELLYSYLWMAQEAELRKSRVGILGDIESMRTILVNKSYGDKHGESTTTYKMFDDFVRFNLYGQSESFSFETNFGILSEKVNLAPLIKKFQSWIRLVNLGFSVLTPITSFLQGSVNFQIEKFVGERIDKDASRLARKQLVKLLPETMSDVMKLTSSSKLNIISEFMGQESSLERFKNSNYNRLTRGIAQSAYMTHSAADVPLSAQVMLTVLHDFRIVNGKLTTFAKFAEENKSKTKKEARAAWAAYEDKVLYNYIKIENGVAKVTDELRKEVPDIDIRMQNVRNSISVAKQEVDSQIPSTDRTQMQRHALLSFLTLHKGWLITSMTRRFKSKHLNLYTGLEEEGSYSGTFGSDSFFSDLVRSWKKDGISYKAVKENWKNSSITRRRSMQRVAADIAVTNALVLVALLLKGWADDDKDKDFVTQFTAYMSYRLAVEVTSQSTSFSNQVYKFLESPTTGLTQIQNVLDITNVLSGKEVTRGTYKGLSEREAWFFKSLPALKEYWKIANIDRSRKSFEFFNNAVIGAPFTVIGGVMEEDKEDKE